MNALASMNTTLSSSPALLVALFALGCAEAATPDPEQATPTSGPLYAVATAVTDDNGSNTYVKAFSEFEDELDLSTAREFPGWSDMGTIGPFLFVSSGEGPTVWRFRVSADGELLDDDVIDFGFYADDANFYNQTIVSETKAYLIGEDRYIVWNPTTLEITGTIPFPELPKRDGLFPSFGFDRSAVFRDGRLYAAATWSDVENLHFLPDSRIVVIDTATDEVVDVLEAPCPDLGVADRDAAGNLYFSNWVYSPGGTLLEDGPGTCVVRIPAGSDAVEDWQFDYAAESGHEGATFGYLGQGQWLYSSFTNDLARYDPNEDWFDWLFGDYWELRTLNPETGDTQAVSGAPLNGGGYYAARLGETMHVLLPADGYKTTDLYAIGPDGRADMRMHMNGWSTRIVKLR